MTNHGGNTPMSELANHRIAIEELWDLVNERKEKMQLSERVTQIILLQILIELRSQNRSG